MIAGSPQGDAHPLVRRPLRRDGAGGSDEQRLTLDRAQRGTAVVYDTLELFQDEVKQRRQL